jgi:hypothetical protein
MTRSPGVVNSIWLIDSLMSGSASRWEPRGTERTGLTLGVAAQVVVVAVVVVAQGQHRCV